VLSELKVHACRVAGESDIGREARQFHRSG